MTATVYYNDSEPFVCTWLKNLIAAKLLPAGDVDERPIQEVSPDDVRNYTQAHFFAGIGGWPYALQLAGWGDRPVWTGSCPCQPLSGAGQRKGHADQRHLWPAFYRLIAECRPPVVFGEQVAGKDGREWLAAVRADLEGAGYAVGAADLCAASAGAPHIRQRLWWVADAHQAGRKNLSRCPGQAQPRRLSVVGAYDSPALQHATSERRGTGRRIEQSEARQAGRRVDQWPDQPAVSLVADGVSRELDGILSRVNAGFGNAIVPRIGAEFVSAYLECAP